MITAEQPSTIVETDPLPGETGEPSESVALSGESVELPGEPVALAGESVELPGEPVALAGESVELPDETCAETPADLPLSLGAVGYAAFALLQPIPLDEIVPFPSVVAAFEAEAARLATPAPVAPSAPEAVQELEPEYGTEAPAWSPEIPLTVTPEPAVAYTEGGYRPSSGATWNDEFLSSDQAASLDPADDQAEDEDEPAGYSPAVTPVGQQFTAGGYAANSPSGDSRARQVLDELSFLFDK